MIKGVDVSHWQGDLDWLSLSTVYDFAFIKATQGTWLTDEKLLDNVAGARAAKMEHGLYHFLDPCEPGREQYDYFMDQTQGLHGFLPDVLDAEWQAELDNNDYTELVLDFLTECPFPVGDPGMWLLYANLNFLDNIINRPKDIARLADISLAWPSTASKPQMPKHYLPEKVKIWQYDWSGGLDKNKVLDEAWYKSFIFPMPTPDPEIVVQVIAPKSVKIEVIQR